MSHKEQAKYLTQLTKRGDHPSLRLTVSSEAVAFIRDTALASPRAETGGILIGHHKGRDIHVVKATDAGPGATRSRCGFLRDTLYCQGVLNREFEKTGADYLGEWHTHVLDLPRPSEGDLRTLAAIMLDPDYQFPSFAMILAIVLDKNVDLLSYVVTVDEYPENSARKLVRVDYVIPQLS